MFKFLVVFFLTVVVVYVFPYMWKLSGGSFVWGKKAIYKGTELFVAQDGCAIAYSKGLEKVDLLCGNNKRTWVNGKETSK